MEKVCTWRATDRLRAIPNKVFGRTDRIENLAFFSEVTGLDRRELAGMGDGRTMVTVQDDIILEDLALSVRAAQTEDGHFAGRTAVSPFPAGSVRKTAAG